MSISTTTGQPFEEVTVGSSFARSVTVTETHIVLAAGLFGDFAPLHVDEEYAKASMFQTRIAHGTLTTGIMAAALSSHFHGTSIGYLEQNVRFLAPVFPGDTITSEWTILDKIEKPKLGGGIVTLGIVCRNQRDVVLLEGTAKAIIRAASS